MSHQNVDIVRAHVEAAKRGDWRAALESYDEAVVLDQSLMPGGGIHHGKSGVREFFTEWFGAWEDLSLELERVIDAGERVIAVMRISGRGRDSGVDVSVRAVDAFTLREGKIVQQVGYPEADEALAELGIVE